MGACSCDPNFEKDYIPNSTKFIDPIVSNIIKDQSLSLSEDKFDLNYEKQGSIGEGAYGKCLRVIDKKTKQEFCAKTFRRFRNMVWKEEEIKKEIQIMKRLDHPNICKLVDFYFEKNAIYMVMEILNGGDLLDDNFEHLKKKNENVISKIMQQILFAIHYLHSNNICHRDIKCENILFKSEKSDVVKLIDFGSATEFKENVKMSEVVGTTYYMAPEVINSSYTEKSDIWACGVIMHILLTGVPPYNGDSEDEILEKIKKGGYEIDKDSTLDTISPKAKSLLNKMLQTDYTKRSSALECLNDEWIKHCDIKIDLSTFNKETKFITNYKKRNIIEIIATKYLISHLVLEDEMEEARNIFKEIDTNQSGTIQKEEIYSFLKKSDNNKTDILQEVDNIFKNLDLNGSGKIEYSEFVASYVKNKQLISDEFLKKMFNSLDADKSGKVNSEELKKLFKTNKYISKDFCQSIIKEIDQNQDEMIELDEFMMFMKKSSDLCKSSYSDFKKSIRNSK